MTEPLTPLQIKAFQDLRGFCLIMNGGSKRVSIIMNVAVGTVYSRMKIRNAKNAKWCADALKAVRR